MRGPIIRPVYPGLLIRELADIDVVRFDKVMAQPVADIAIIFLIITESALDYVMTV
jgi:hypothetical protein